MAKLSALEPTKKPRLMDLVKAAGVDTSRWAKNFKREKKFAALNPKYCYEWSFVEPEKVVVLNYWHRNLKAKNGRIIIEENLEKFGSDKKSKKLLGFHAAIKLAHDEKLPVRIIIQKSRVPKDYARVYKRKLDEMFWNVSRRSKDGIYVITRGENENAIDDLATVPAGSAFPDRAKRTCLVIKRDNGVRAYVLERAKGRCEYCNAKGFQTTIGGFYLETHHIIALCNSGRDTVENVIALCPLHHRQAHFGVDGDSLEEKFIIKLKKIESGSVIPLSQKDARQVLSLLNHPPKPNQRLKGAAKSFKSIRT